MSVYDNTDSGVLFKNENKFSANSPDYTGEINVEGIEKSLSAWVQISNTGKKYLKMKKVLLHAYCLLKLCHLL